MYEYKMRLLKKKNMKEYTQMTMNDPHLPTMEPKKNKTKMGEKK